MEKINFEFKEVELLGFEDLTSGYLEVTDHVVQKTGNLTGTAKEVNRGLKRLAVDKATKDGGNEEDYTFTVGDLVGTCKTKNGTDMARSNIDEYLKKMVDKDQVVKVDNNYQ